MGIPRLVPDGARARKVAGPAPRAGAPRTYRSEAERSAREPWRARGYGRAYRAERQACIERARGRCERCGREVAFKDARTGRWTVRGGETHHTVPLAEGGRGRLALLCVPCHRAADAAARDARRRRGGGSE